MFPRRFLAAFLLAVLIAPRSLQATPEPGAGVIRPAPNELGPNEVLVAVFSEGSPAMASVPGAPPSLPGQPVPNCLSVVQIYSSRGRPRLTTPAQLSFECPDAPEEAVVFGWIENRWVAFPTARDPEHRLGARFTDLSTYGLFLPSFPANTLTNI